MNYIKQLQEENKDLKAHKEYAVEQINYMLRYLDSDKFKGPDNNYVNASEMYHKLLTLRSNL